MLLLLTLLTAPQSIPEKTLAKLKDATVFVQAEDTRWKATGSGFLLHTDGSTGYAVTNAHVVSSGGRVAASVRLVFKSGSSDEFTADAQVAALDESRDLAFLKIERDGLPAPISPDSKVKLRETLPLFILGFPFGEALSSSRRNPAVTVGRGTVSSLRNDDYGRLSVIQIDGDLNPGNSGGPIVDEKGALVGVAVAKVEGTQIGMAIPADDLKEMQQGRVGGVTVNQIPEEGGGVRVEVTATLIDPMERMQRVSVLLVPREKLKADPKPDASGAWGPATAGMKEVKLDIKDRAATGSIVLSGTAGKDEPYVFQTKYVRGDSKTIHTQPSDLAVAFSRSVAKEPKGGHVPADDDDWLGSEEDKKKREAAAAGKPSITGTDLRGEGV